MLNHSPVILIRQYFIRHLLTAFVALFGTLSDLNTSSDKITSAFDSISIFLERSTMVSATTVGVWSRRSFVPTRRIICFCQFCCSEDYFSNWKSNWPCLLRGKNKQIDHHLKLLYYFPFDFSLLAFCFFSLLFVSMLFYSMPAHYSDIVICIGNHTVSSSIWN